jgi:hypothetical protein
MSKKGGMWLKHRLRSPGLMFADPGKSRAIRLGEGKVNGLRALSKRREEQGRCGFRWGRRELVEERT